MLCKRRLSLILFADNFWLWAVSLLMLEAMTAAWRQCLGEVQLDSIPSECTWCSTIEDDVPGYLELDGERLDFGKTLESFDLEDGDLIDATVDDSMPAPSHGEASSGSASVAASCAQHVSPDEPARKIVVHVDCDGATKKFRVLDTDPLSKLFSGAATALHLSPEAQFYFGERVPLGSATSRSAGRLRAGVATSARP